MVQNNMIEYIRSQAQLGVNPVKIINSLLSVKWRLNDIVDTFTYVLGRPLPAETLSIFVQNPIQTQNNYVSQTTYQQQNNQTTVVYAGFWVRFLALSVDTFIIFLLILLSLKIIPIEQIPITAMVITLLYLIIAFYAFGSTIGKKLLNITITRSDFSNISILRFLLRELIGKAASAAVLMIGYIMSAFGEKKQALHDKLTDTVVIYKDPNKSNTLAIVFSTLLLLALPIFAFFFVKSHFQTIVSSIFPSNSTPILENTTQEENKKPTDIQTELDASKNIQTNTSTETKQTEELEKETKIEESNNILY